MSLTQAQIEAIRSLEDESGRVTPQQVVTAARDKASPLHDLFDWNAKEAAGKWWLHQAREVIGAVRIQIVNTESAVKAPMYVKDTESAGAGYRSVASMRDDPAAARESLIYTLTVASGHLRRAYDLAKPLGLESEIEALVAHITGLRMSVSKVA